MNADQYAEAISEALPEMRALAESLMLDACIVERPTGRKSQNEATGREERLYETLFTSKCRIKDQGYADAGSRVGGQQKVIGTTVVNLPWNIDDVREDDRIRITAIGPMTAARHLGKAYIIGTDHDRSLATATRLIVREEP